MSVTHRGAPYYGTEPFTFFFFFIALVCIFRLGVVADPEPAGSELLSFVGRSGGFSFDTQNRHPPVMSDDDHAGSVVGLSINFES